MRRPRHLLLCALLASFSLFASGCGLDDLFEDLKNRVSGEEAPAAEAETPPQPPAAEDEPPTGEDAAPVEDDAPAEEEAPAEDDAPVVVLPEEGEPTETPGGGDPVADAPGGGGMGGGMAPGHEMDHSLMPKIDNATLMAPATGTAAQETVVQDRRNAAGGSIGKVRFVCRPTKMGYIDPILAPGNNNFWHLHTFFGNTDINPDSDLDNLAASGNSTCAGGIHNRSSYWVPTVIDTRTGAAVKPTSMMTYYDTFYQSGTFEEYPDGLRILAGDATATSPQGETNGRKMLSFRCKTLDGGGTDYTDYSFPDCNPGNAVWQQATLPNCWNGNDLWLDGGVHMSYMGKGRVCPASHPHRLPVIAMHVSYDVEPGTSPAQHWRLSSDAYSSSQPGGYSAHADYVFGWSDSGSKEWMDFCITERRDCGTSHPGR